MEISIQKLTIYIEHLLINEPQTWEDTLTKNLAFLKEIFQFKSPSILEGAIWEYANGNISKQAFQIHLERFR